MNACHSELLTQDCDGFGHTLPSSDPEAIRESLNGDLREVSAQIKSCLLEPFYQSVSKTTAVCPLNRGNCSGNRPFSLMGMTANAPPPLASQLTEIYCGFAYGSVRPGLKFNTSCTTFTRFVSQAFLEIRMLS